MRIGVLILPDAGWAENARRWRRCDELGFSTGWTYDHIWWRGLRDAPWFAAVPVLTAAAAVTGRLRIGLMVGSPNFRHPVTLAKEAVAIDDISGGRFVLGIGSGAPKAGDAEVLGGSVLDAAERAERFGEFVELTSELLAEPVVNRVGKYFSASEARMIPGCTQQPRLPLAVAASGPAGIDLAARCGDAWITAGPADWLGGYTPDECHRTVVEQSALLDERCRRAGRDPQAVQRIVIATPMCGNPLESPAACRQVLARYAEIGIDEMVIHWPRSSGVYAGHEHVLEEIARTVLPELDDTARRTTTDDRSGGHP